MAQQSYQKEPRRFLFLHRPCSAMAASSGILGFYASKIDEYEANIRRLGSFCLPDACYVMLSKPQDDTCPPPVIPRVCGSTFLTHATRRHVPILGIRWPIILIGCLLPANQVVVREKTQNLRRLEAQRNELNAKVRLLREEISLLQEPGSYVGEVVKVMGRKKVSRVPSECASRQCACHESQILSLPPSTFSCCSS